ncbi:hypothetical protein H9W95_06075 [Flavobacterium lindanitolerans]|nr:hypothetical protein [Flavobacterium lindanitolerans]
MSNSKLDLFEQSWIENVFEGRNKSYGAYELRTNSGKRTLKALAIGAVIFLFMVCIPIISKFISENMTKEEEVLDEQVVLVNVQEPIKKEEIIVEPVVQKQTQSNVDIQKYVPPVVVDKQVVREEVAVVEELKKTGSETVKAKEGGEVVLDGTQSEIKIDAEVIEEDPNKIYTSVQVLPEFPWRYCRFLCLCKKELQNP